MVDFHRRFTRNKNSGEDEYRLSKKYTLVWGIFCIVVAMFSYNLGNSLIEAVNILGSLFYGVILGVFLVAFFCKKITNGDAVFWAAISTEIIVITVYILTRVKIINMGFLWLNPIGAFGVLGFAMLFNKLIYTKRKTRSFLTGFHKSFLAKLFCEFFQQLIIQFYVVIILSSGSQFF